MLATSYASAQNAGRVGINTTQPEATLDIGQISDALVPETYPQGISFPNFSTERRSKFEKVKIGTMIYNTTLNCVEIYRVPKGGGPAVWECMSCGCDANSSQYKVQVIPSGFTTTPYVGGVHLSYDMIDREVIFTLKNDSYYPITSLDLSKAVTITNGGSDVSVVQGYNSNVSVPAGRGGYTEILPNRHS